MHMKDALTCKQAVDHILKKEEIKLSGKQRVRLWRHLQDCELCRTFLWQNKLLNEFVGMHYDFAINHLSEIDKEQILKKALGED